MKTEIFLGSLDLSDLVGRIYAETMEGNRIWLEFWPDKDIPENTLRLLSESVWDSVYQRLFRFGLTCFIGTPLGIVTFEARFIYNNAKSLVLFPIIDLANPTVNYLDDISRVIAVGEDIRR